MFVGYKTLHHLFLVVFGYLGKEIWGFGPVIPAPSFQALWAAGSLTICPEDAGGELLALHAFLTLCGDELGLCWHLEPSFSSSSLSSSSPSLFSSSSPSKGVCAGQQQMEHLLLS